MKIICAYSGLHYTIPEHFSDLRLHAREVHPVFSLSAETLCNLYESWVKRELSNAESYLLALALLHSTGLLEFRCAAIYDAHSETVQSAVINTHMQALFNVSQLLIVAPYPQFIAPKLVITENTRSLDCLGQWVKIWRSAYDDFRSGLAESIALDALKRKEAALAALINSPQIPEHKYAHVLADWASLAAAFPPEYAAYWKECIIKCYQAQSALVIPAVHLQDIRDWCEEHLDEYSCGSIFSHRLYSLISAVQDCQSDFELIIPAHEQHAAIQSAIQSAPAAEPIRTDYPSQIEYMRAKSAWILAQNQQGK